jgi:hypothetical protein
MYRLIGDTHQTRTTSASFTASTFPSPARISTFGPIIPIPLNILLNFLPVSSLPTVAMKREGRASSGASRNSDVVGVEMPEAGSVECPLGKEERVSREANTPERMATPMVPQPV